MPNCLLPAGPSLKTLCKLAVIQYSLDQSCLPHDIRYCVPCWKGTPWVLPVLGVLQPCPCRAAGALLGTLQLQGRLGWRPELRLMCSRAAPAVGTVVMLSLTVLHRCVTDGSSRP